MQQVDVERAQTYILQAAASQRLFPETVLIMQKKHNHHQHQRIHGGSLWQVGPFATAEMPLENVGTRQKCHQRDSREKIPAPKQSLNPAPVAMHQISNHEEVHKLQRLIERGIHHKVRLVPSAQSGLQIDAQISQETGREQQPDGQI